MRVAIVGPRGIPATYSGPETAAEQIAVRLVERGHEVTVFCRRHHYRHDPGPIYWHGVRRRLVGGIATKHLDTISHSTAAALRVDRRRFDAALVAIVGNLPVAAFLRARRVPVVFNVDGTDSGRAKWGPLASLYLRLAERAAGRAADVLVTDAESLRNQFRGARDLRVIPYGSERSRRPPGPALAGLDLEPGRYLLHVGRLVPENGALEVVRAHASIDEPRLPLVVVGGDPYETAYQRQVRASAGPGVLFAGFRYGAEYEELMTSAAGLVVAVTVGGTHPVVTEAMGFGLAVVAPDVPVMREVLGDAAVFFRPGGLAEAIARLPDPALGRRASRRAAERYSWDAVTSAYEEALAAAVRARTAG